jgi:hypothetical protein
MKNLITLVFLSLFGLGIIKVKAQIITTFAGNGVVGNAGDGGPASLAELSNPSVVTTDNFGNVYIPSGNYLRKVNSAGIISTIAGNGVWGYTGDGGPATAASISITDLAVDAFGNIYFTDPFHKVVRKIDTSGIISTIAGTGICCYTGDGGPAIMAQVNAWAIDVDSVGNVFITNSAYQLSTRAIRKIDTMGVISTILDTLNTIWPLDFKLDGLGNTYIVSFYNQIYKMDSTGVISLFAGIGSSGNSGNGGPAILAEFGGFGPSFNIALDNFNNLYIADWENNLIRKVNSNGIINAFAGTGANGYSGDGGPANLATFHLESADISCDLFGNLYVPDYNNNVIRKINTCAFPPEICMVQVDSLSQNNIIYWDKTQYAADTFYVYRDTANYNYALIGKVPNDSLSMFIDTVRSLYAANGDPNASSWRYKLAYGSTCGGARTISSMSPYHQTLFMINSGSNFIWTHYQIEGQSQPVSGLQNYIFQRDNNGTGNFVDIQNLSASSTLYNDAQYATYQNTANWRVETLWNTSCTPTRATVNTTRSNIRRNSFGSGIETSKPNSISIFPNPANESITIKNEGFVLGKNTTIKIYDMVGALVYHEPMASKTMVVNVQSYAKGIYTIAVESHEQCLYNKLIVK